MEDIQKAKRRCFQMFVAGFSVKEMSEETKVPISTIYGWSKRGHWNNPDPLKAAETRFRLLTGKNGKTAGEIRELQTLANIIGQFKKIS